MCMDIQELEGRGSRLLSTGQAMSSSAGVSGSRTRQAVWEAALRFYFYPNDWKSRSTFFPDNLTAN